MDPANQPPRLYPEDDETAAPPQSVGQWLTQTPPGCAVLAVVPTAALSAALTFLSTNVFQSYGIMVFLASPFIGGLVANAMYTARRAPGEPQPGLVATWVTVVLAALSTLALLVASALEGVICVLMAAPLALLMALIGAWLGSSLSHMIGERNSARVLTVLVLLYPVGQALEARYPVPVPAHRVVTRLRVQASPERVWQVLTRPVQYPAEVGWLFRAGVAYPTRTALQTTPDGRHQLICTYSQGAARLPVTSWQPGRELTFRVPDMPAPMQELSPYPRIHAPHLHGYFRVEQGTFRLLPQPDGSTVLEASTSYRHSIAPRAYWQLWSDYLLDDMHQRVLSAIQTQAQHE
ncbi:hypothetical protein LJ737_24045 [Hymenobacter sp. 15J16-1T3B]|uniref:hypothetical protein n=1 Tax=Hymenobacter sp. 15J16-1T3B TaxID=2886941 RepID=UPI001D0FE6D5|nr:hypothetical protein [Hymenobacter sp. 15J16-1T3B]MCC3160331.1 hypothetical protein [Hymenobacter sp. 15J16-1T3B]